MDRGQENRGKGHDDVDLQLLSLSLHRTSDRDMLPGITDNAADIGVCSGTARKKTGGKDSQRNSGDPENDAALRGGERIPCPGAL